VNQRLKVPAECTLVTIKKFKEFPVSDETSPREFQTTESMQHSLKGQLDLLNYAIKHSYCYERWKKVATFLIRKDQNSSRIHRLRVIHLYEADLSLLLGVKWRSLTHHCVDNDLLNPGQIGGLPCKGAITPVFLEELQWETTRASRKPFCVWTPTPRAATTGS
jgi:hypothetical protein